MVAIIEVNFTNKRDAYTITSLSLGKVDFFGAMDGYIFFQKTSGDKKTGEIQYRLTNIGGTWQGEIIGQGSKKGKVSGGPTKEYVRKYFKENLELQNEIASQVGNMEKRKSTDTFYKNKFYPIYKDAARKTGIKVFSYDNWFDQIKDKKRDWITSKYCSTSLINIISGHNKQSQDAFITELLNYAGSRSELSAPYLLCM